MFNWLIKLLGGYTEHEYLELELHLNQARKNDTPRDPKTGRFVKN